jgi:cell division protein FtsW (lipid II flippase)
MNVTNTDQVQARLLRLGFLFLLLYAIAYSLAPAVRMRSLETSIPWQHWIGLGVWVLVASFLHRQTAKSLPDRDPFLLPIGALLSGWGLLTIYRLSTGLGLRQTAWLAFTAALVFLLIQRMQGLVILRRYKYVWLTSGLLLTALTLIFGTNPLGYGPRLWLGCCGIYLQPSEPLKLLLVTYLAAYLADRQLLLQTIIQSMQKKSLRYTLPLLPILAPTLLMTSLALVVMVIQQDLGAASIFLFLYACMVYLAIQKRRVLWMSFTAIILSGFTGYVLFDVVRLRVDAWWNPWSDPSGRSYQIVQSILAVANGGLLGRGPGMGSPSLVPIAHSDFIFTAIVEEAGLLGGLGILALFGLLAQRSLRAAVRAPDLFQRLLAGGLSAYLVGQAILIIGGNVRVFPLTGVTLPFVSYGGSSLVTSILALIIILLVSNHSRDDQTTAIFTRPYQELLTFLVVGLSAASLILGWWAIINTDSLLLRTDNARRSIAERFVMRGIIYDRQGIPLADNAGEPGNLTRQYLYPDLSNVLGYTHTVYGQAGLEASFDPWLRGLQGYSTLALFREQLLFGQNPPGLGLRLTIDISLQQNAMELLNSAGPGAIIIMDVANGDLLTLASYPSFDPNDLERDWETLIQDQRAPFVNRTSLGLYPTGASLIPFLMTKVYENETVIPLPTQTNEVECAIPKDVYAKISPASVGCNSFAFDLAERIDSRQLLDLFRDLGFYQAPLTQLPAIYTPEPETFLDKGNVAIGETPALKLSPLQMAIAVGSLSAAGTRPAPRILLAVETPVRRWENQPAMQDPLPVLASTAVTKTTLALSDPQLPIWQHLTVVDGVPDGRGAFTWLTSGTLASWQGKAKVIVILLEKSDPQSALDISLELWEKILNP